MRHLVPGRCSERSAAHWTEPRPGRSSPPGPAAPDLPARAIPKGDDDRSRAGLREQATSAGDSGHRRARFTDGGRSTRRTGRHSSSRRASACTPATSAEHGRRRRGSSCPTRAGAGSGQSAGGGGSPGSAQGCPTWRSRAPVPRAGAPASAPLPAAAAPVAPPAPAAAPPAPARSPAPSFGELDLDLPGDRGGRAPGRRSTFRARARPRSRRSRPRTICSASSRLPSPVELELPSPSRGARAKRSVICLRLEELATCRVQRSGCQPRARPAEVFRHAEPTCRRSRSQGCLRSLRRGCPRCHEVRCRASRTGCRWCRLPGRRPHLVPSCRRYRPRRAASSSTRFDGGLDLDLEPARKKASQASYGTPAAHRRVVRRDRSRR